MKKFIQIIIFTFIYLILNIFQSFADEKIKIGLIVPLSGEYKEIGSSIVKSARLAVNKIDDSRIEIIPRDTKSNPETTLRVSKELYEQGVKIIIGPVFNKNLVYLNELDEVIFLSLSNTNINNPKNVISGGINAISQINAIKKFQELARLERSILLIASLTDFNIELPIFLYSPDRGTIKPILIFSPAKLCGITSNRLKNIKIINLVNFFILMIIL